QLALDHFQSTARFTSPRTGATAGWAPPEGWSSSVIEAPALNSPHRVLNENRRVAIRAIRFPQQLVL
ncbi:MAG TPA: hypothetical protein VHK01_00850, partial [Lacipirellulaceae bacterium]|nr:hypothetical protein [Lacipirellulaceae bacterium]